MKRILAAVDDSNAAELVVRRAATLALATGAKVLLFHAIVPPEDTLVLAELVTRAEAELTQRQTLLDERVRGGVRVVAGRPWEEICSAAKELDVDLVVIGAHCYGIAERLLGTTAAKVVDHLDRPLLVERTPARDRRGWAGLASPSVLAARLSAEHGRLEKVCRSLVDAYRAGDWEEVTRAWAAFEPALRAHMELEEREVFPTFRVASPEEAAALAADHVEMRRILDVLGVNLELHALPIVEAEELVRRIRAHAAREERVLYPWLAKSERANARPTAA